MFMVPHKHRCAAPCGRLARVSPLETTRRMPGQASPVRFYARRPLHIPGRDVPGQGLAPGGDQPSGLDAANPSRIGCAPGFRPWSRPTFQIGCGQRFPAEPGPTVRRLDARQGFRPLDDVQGSAALDARGQ